MEIKKAKTTPYPMRLTLEEIEQLDILQEYMGLTNRVQVVKQLIKAAYVRPASIKFVRTEEDKAIA